jgi:hypothetical protein
MTPPYSCLLSASPSSHGRATSSCPPHIAPWLITRHDGNDGDTTGQGTTAQWPVGMPDRSIKRGWCRGVETAESMLFESVSEYEVYGGSGGLRNTRITQRRRNGLSWFRPIRSLRPAADDPYTQEHPKSGGYNRV